jgi:galactokinase
MTRRVRDGGSAVVSRWRAPGRVNLIGEHTDYNQGFALPFAIAAGCTATVSTHSDAELVVRSAQLDQSVVVPLADLAPGVGAWAGYPLGVVWELRRRGIAVPGLEIELDSDVPRGAGLSSSAALVCSVACAVDELLGLALQPDELLAITRAAENDFVGAPTGGMDQLAALRCASGHALFCDMRTLAAEQVPVDLAPHGLTVLVLDTRAEHKHASGEYRRRREGCERAAGELGVRALSDIGVDDLPDALARLSDDELRRYVRHVVTEDDRVLRTVELLRAGRPGDIGTLLSSSHASMRDDFRITIPELDVAAEVLVDHGALGARMTGGGFGGCVIALIGADLVADAEAAVRREYAARGFREPGAFTVRPAPGAHRLE